MEPHVDIRKMNLSGLEILHKFCGDVYTLNFHTHWDDGGLEQYIDEVFGTAQLTKDLSDKNVLYYMAFTNRQPAGFMKLNLFSNLPGFNVEKGLELEKIYILPELKRMKIGRRLLDLAFEIAGQQKKEIFWLSVIDSNTEALSFYEKAGFKFHSKARLNYPKFKKELRGMWRMYFELPGIKAIDQ